MIRSSRGAWQAAVHRVARNPTRLRAGGTGGKRGLDGWMAYTDSMDMSLSKLQETVKDREVPHAAVHGVAKSWT